MSKPRYRSAIVLGALLAAALMTLGFLVFAGSSSDERAAQENYAWPLHGGARDGARFSRLDQINRENISQLGLAWAFDLNTRAGQEATPIMVDGVLYTVSAYDVVYALNAKNGDVLWSYDPQVRAAASRSCCGPVSRGVAVEKGHVFLGALDGRLIALDANSGAVIWEVQTIDQPHPPAVNYTITGAPHVIKGRVVIGNGGAEFGARGYVSAYDADTGKLAWRFYTVPGAPGTIDDAASDAALAKAAPTWSGEWWRWGGGGTVWDAIAYDPALNLIYIGAGNGSPANHGLRSNGEGDNLYLASIIALRADTGEYVWHYQQNPGESWDYTATQNIIFADLSLNGETRKVLMQAPKNGFFYVLDRASGELISAEPFAHVTWAEKIDMATGRPVENPAARYYKTGESAVLFPSSGGAHNWPPMAYSPDTGLVYIPAQDVGIVFAPDTDQPLQPGAYNSGMAMQGGESFSEDALREIYGSMKGYLLAWDPVSGKAAWRRELAAPFNGGVLATRGALVFEGNAAGEFAAYDAQNGRTLWRFDVQTGVKAPPITYEIDGVQYVAVMAGWGGAWSMLGGQLALKAGNPVGVNRLLVFRLGGDAKLPEPTAMPTALAPPAATDQPAPLVAAGDRLYGRYCLRCHGIAAVSASFVPDLRTSGYAGNEDAFELVVLDGALRENGMPGFKDLLSKPDAQAIRAYIQHRAFADASKNLE